MRNLQLLSRPRAAEQDRGLFLFWRWRRFCAVKLRPIGQPPDSGHQCAYRPGTQRGVFFFFVALRSGRSGFLVGGRVGRVGHERGIPQSLLGCREFSFKALRLGFPGGGAGTPRGSLLLVFQFRRPAGCRRRHPQISSASSPSSKSSIFVYNKEISFRISRLALIYKPTPHRRTTIVVKERAVFNTNNIFKQVFNKSVKQVIDSCRKMGL